MNHRILKSLVLVSTILSFGLISNKNNYKVNVIAESDSYYASIDSAITGSDLTFALNKLNTSKLKKRVGYDAMRTLFYQTDYDPNDKSKLLSFYSGTSASYSSMNREHTWPASRTVLGRGKDPLEDDIHMVRPTLQKENSQRGNSFFAESGAWDPASFGNDSYRGDAARIIFYCAIADTNLSIVDKYTDDASNHTMGKLSDLLKWNLAYSVQQREINRNEGAENLQGNRNPFIDHPEYACRIWGNTNASTQAICGSYEKAPNKITISPENPTIEIGEKISLNVTVDSGSSSVTWSTPNNTIISLDNGNITGLKEGKALVTATSTIDNSVYATTEITVVQPKTIESLKITGIANKLSYYEGDEFDATGLTIKAIYDDGTSSVIDNSLCTFSSLSKGDTKVTITYKGISAVYEGITVLTKQAASNTFEKVTSNLSDWTGTYLLVYENSSTQGYVWTGVDSAKNYESYTISDSQIVFDETKGTSLDIAKNSDGYSIKVLQGDNHNKFVGRAASSNGLDFSDSAINNTLSYSSNSIEIKSGSTTIRFNNASDQLRFRYYRSGQQPVQLYKAVGKSSEVSDAESYASKFLETITCSGKGSVTFNESQWTLMAEEFDKLSEEDKSTLINAKVNLSSSSLIEQFAARYDAIVSKYPDKYDNFMNRSLPNYLRDFERIENNNYILFIVLFASITIGVGTLSIYLIKRKRSK